VTDDVKNAHTRASWTDYHKLKEAERPEFQDRQATSIKMREIDITIPKLIKTY